MKKRLLITSIVMMLVVAVALSTATYAWFTQNASVTANSVTMTAATANAQSISIAWYGSESRQTFLSAGAPSSPLQPMCPTAQPVTTPTATTAAGIAYNTAFVDTAGAFIGTTVASADPYTWNNGSGATAFYINNDSNSQAVPVYVTVNTIEDLDTLTPLADNTLLEGSGKVYYRKSGDTYTKLVEGTDYTANVSKVTDTAAASGDNINTGLASGTIYSTKGIADYIRVAIFATSHLETEPESIAPANYSYKGLLSKTPATNDTVFGTITNNGSLSTMSSSNEVQVIDSLPALERVYVIVKVWLDGADFTQHENALTASVSLTFSTTSIS